MKNRTQAVPENCPVVRIEAEEILFPYFQPVFQAGFLFRCQVGQSIADLLFRQLSLERDFVEKKISTVFLDGQCVDDISMATMKDGSAVAFSSALPGLVGATLRRDGFYACLRDSITYRKEDVDTAVRKGTITIKLFNLLMDELGPVFLKRGIIMDRTAVVNFFQARKNDFWEEISAVHFQGLSIGPKELTQESTYDNYGRLKICVDKKSGFNEKDQYLSNRLTP